MMETEAAQVAGRPGLGRGGAAARRPARRRDPGAQLPGSGDPGRCRPRRRLAGAVPARRGEHRERHRVRRRLLHGRNRQDPCPGPDGADPGAEGWLLAGRQHHRAPGSPVEGRASRRRGGGLREHQRRGQGGIRSVLYLGQRGGDRGVRPGATGRCCSCPISSSALMCSASRAAPICTSGSASATCTPGSARTSCGGRPAPTPRPSCSSIPDAGARPLRCGRQATGDLPPGRTRVLSTGGMLDGRPHHHGANRPGRDRDRHAAPVAAGQPGRQLGAGQPGRRMPVHEDEYAGRPAALPSRGHDGGDRRPWRGPPGPPGGRGDDRRARAAYRRARAAYRGADASDRARSSATCPGRRCAWERDADVVVVGSGAAGMTAALAAARHGRRVLLISKQDLGGGATPLAQGGLAAAIGPADNPALHQRDTLDAGAGLCDPAAVATLVSRAPDEIARLAGRGARLERTARAPGGRAQPHADRERRRRRDRRGGAPGAPGCPAGQPGPGPHPLRRPGRTDR